MTDLVMSYTVDPVWEGLKAFGRKWIAAQEAHGRARAAHYLASMGYYKEAKELMLQGGAE